MAREKLLVAKEAAEQRGFRVLHALVDSIYVQKKGDQGPPHCRLPIADCRLTSRKPKIETRNSRGSCKLRISIFEFRPSIENRQSKIVNFARGLRTPGGGNRADHRPAAGAGCACLNR